MTDSPQFLIEWSSPWQEFLADIGPALRPSPPRLRFETRAGLFPFRGMLLTMLLEIAALAGAMVLHLDRIQPAPFQPPPSAHDVIYFSADELPRTEDLAGAGGGKAGRSGGSSLRHTQAIKVARDETIRERVADAPRLDLPKSDSQIQNLLAYRADVGPAPAEALPMNRQTPVPKMALAVAPPPPDIQTSAIQRQTRPAQLANPAVVPPPAEISQHDLTHRAVLPPTAVVAPPVSAPVEITSHPPRLTLPAEGVVAPRPEVSSAAQSRRVNADFVPRVVPPPVDISHVPPSTSAASLSGSQTVAPPPVEMQEVRRNAVGALGSAAVAPPPADVQKARSHSVRGLGRASVAAPPAEIASLRLEHSPVSGNASVIPPPNLPPTTTHSADGGAGTGKGPLSSGEGVVVSAQPGNRPGLPANSEKATLAMSPTGSASPGAGGSGGGSGIGRGNTSGSAPAGVGSGSTAVGTGRAANASDRTGSSPMVGPGGTGTLSNGSARVPGVSVSSGSNVVTLPSFGNAPDPVSAGHSGAKGVKNGITIVASPRSGGALNLYGALKGDRVYTIYINTGIGTAIMQFADPDSAAHPYDTDLTAPQAIRVNLPPDLTHSRLLIACVLDRNGTIRHWHVLQADSGDFSAKILAALPDWKFSPAFRGDQAVEVNAILGFGVDTK